MNRMWGLEAGVRFLDWTCELGTRREEEEGKQIWVEIMSSASDLWGWIKVTFRTAKGHVKWAVERPPGGEEGGLGPWELSAQRKSPKPWEVRVGPREEGGGGRLDSCPQAFLGCGLNCRSSLCPVPGRQILWAGPGPCLLGGFLGDNELEGLELGEQQLGKSRKR